MSSEKILYIDACPRKESRTRRLADALAEQLSGEVEQIVLTREKLPEIDEKAVEKRAADGKTGDFSDPVYRYAKQFAEADTIVIAAPFWDLSFPAILKKYLEAVSVTGITFSYSEEGIPVGMCKAKKLYYVTTAGGPIWNDEFGYGYVKALVQSMFGIPETERISAENLDIWGNDADEIVNEAIQKLKK